MPNQVSCSHCRVMLKVPDGMEGRKVRCTSCQGVFEIPAVPLAVSAVPILVTEPPPPAPAPVPNANPFEFNDTSEAMRSRPGRGVSRLSTNPSDWQLPKAALWVQILGWGALMLFGLLFSLGVVHPAVLILIVIVALVHIVGVAILLGTCKGTSARGLLIASLAFFGLLCLVILLLIGLSAANEGNMRRVATDALLLLIMILFFRAAFEVAYAMALQALAGDLRNSGLKTLFSVYIICLIIFRLFNLLLILFGATTAVVLFFAMLNLALQGLQFAGLFVLLNTIGRYLRTHSSK